MIWATSYWIPLPLLRPSSSFYPRASIVQFFPALANTTPTLYQLSIQIRDEEGWMGNVGKYRRLHNDFFY